MSVHSWLLHGGQAAAAGAITERLGKLHGFGFDPIKQGEQAVQTPPSRTEATVVDFKAANQRYTVEQPLVVMGAESELWKSGTHAQPFAVSV